MRILSCAPLLLPLLAACSQAGAESAGGDRPYKVGGVERGEVQVVVEQTGVVEPERQIVIKSPISGVVQRLEVREGDRVAAGARLARIVPDIAQANSFARLRSDIATSEIARDNAHRELERAQALSATGGLTQSELDTRRVAYEQADNALRTARDQLRLVQASGVTTGDRQYADLVAPSAGVIIRRGVEQGETVVGGTSAFGGGTEVFTIADLSTLLVKAAVNEVDIGKVQPGDSVALSVDAFPGDTVLGIVRLVPPAARLHERIRVFDVEIEARGDGTVLRPGMTANVRIRGPARKGVVRVPVEAVLLDEGDPVVYKVTGTAAPERTAVTLGLSDLTHVEILSGVQPGDSVALEDPAVAAERAARVKK